ncbi:BatA domain-containing protein [Dyadobacter luticola]|uniref:Aerotolerance regulator N-terminal domain-containing protein n=1 Tax=Dyadobacter luticola TaxID=1979387 RepID=A0A5R9L1L8_9BACT|nr:BatA domain-containing protein [Dyadobacter luticola]TLV02277.1 hypothetical protein FEN17_01145 [Dyadobacter luticola]
MELLQPYWLWGMLAVAIPVAIHFWNQKKGQTIEWAATRWLVDKTSLNHRGIRLHEIPLMLLRCLLVALLALILGQPVINWLNETADSQTVHLVQPDRRLVENFRFELEAALKKGEKLFWIGENVTPVSNLTDISNSQNAGENLQQNINKTASAHSILRFYLLAEQKLAELSKIYVPGSFQLFTLPDSSKNSKDQLLFDQNKKWNVLVAYQNPDEQTTASAALNALKDVYGFTFNMDLKLEAGKNYDLVLADHVTKPIDPKALYVISGKPAGVDMPVNVKQVPDSLLLASSEFVESGRLPEWLGEVFAKHHCLVKSNVPLSNQQLGALFVRTKPALETEAREMRKWLLLFFVLTAFLERVISLRKNRVNSYA